MGVVERFGRGSVPAHRRRLEPAGPLPCRNAGADSARGDLLVSRDADDVVAPGWLEAMARPAPGAATVGGALELDALNEGGPRQWCDWEPPDDLSRHHDFLPYVSGGYAESGRGREGARMGRVLPVGTPTWSSAARVAAGHELGFRAERGGPPAPPAAPGEPRRRLDAHGKWDGQLFRRFRPAEGRDPPLTESGGWRGSSGGGPICARNRTAWQVTRDRGARRRRSWAAFGMCVRALTRAHKPEPPGREYFGGPPRRSCAGTASRGCRDGLRVTAASTVPRRKAIADYRRALFSVSRVTVSHGSRCWLGPGTPCRY